MANHLYFGDNLDVLRDSIASDSIDLIYLDPPFNSDASYNVLFASPKGHQSTAQIEAFEDSWHWGQQAEKEFAEILSQPNTQVAEVMRALRQFLGENDMMAYLTMMANRLLELHRVLKSTGSLYLHCDPTASHYLKIVLDAVFGYECFVSEVIWKRTHSHGDPQRKFGAITDTLFLFAKSQDYTFKPQFRPFAPDYIEEVFTGLDPDGRRWQSVTLRSPHPRPNLTYPYKASNGVTYQPHRNGWSCDRERMTKYDKEKRLHFPSKPTGAMRLKMYLDESPGVKIQNLWDDIPPISANAAERLGYPTQKPQALLERIVQTSSKEGDLVLDPFCGCGTAVHAAQKLGRQWIGIDVTHLAISLIEKRLRDAFPGITFEVHGTPKDLGGAQDLATRDKYQFQWWACSLVNAQPYQGKKKGADSGIDGLIFFQDDGGLPKKVIVSVKGGENVGVTMMKDLIATVAHQKADIGIFVTLTEPTGPMLKEAVSAGFYKSPAGGTFPKIQVLTVEDLLSGKARAAYPSLNLGALTFKKAAVEQGNAKQIGLFWDPATGKAKAKGKTRKAAPAASARGSRGRDRG